MKKYLSAAAIAAAGSFMVAGANAEESGVTITPMIGHLWYHDDANLEDGFNGSLAVGYKFSESVAVELAYLTAEPDLDGVSGAADIEQYRFDSLWYLGEERATRPFLVLGAGRQSIDYASASTDFTLYNAGLGLRKAFSDNFAFRGDIRGIVLDDNDQSEVQIDIGVNLGLQWFIGTGGKKKATVSAPAKVLDSDGDGVNDNIDNCPATPAGTQVDATGCPVNLDDDGDGVLNDVDSCPDTEAGAKVDAKGCYVVISEDVTVSLNVNFANNSESMVSGVEQIAKVADFMKLYPLTNVVIEGHTDSLGSESYNQSLSQRRAQAVVNVLTAEYGIDAERVSAVGYGESRPIASNDTNEGRAANRRVSAVVSASVEKIVK